MFDTSGLGLEIGPSFNPLLPKSEGFNIEILDHLDSQGLRSKYANSSGINHEAIEEVDYISTGGSVLDAIPYRERYDYIVACHVIEHTIDLLGFLNDCSALLKHDSNLVLAVPDKRFSFDCLRPVTTTGQILQANHDKRSNHSIGKVLGKV
jgi:2-polyprenyl-3-methyl-5-hydroxy-6-metoxy-1,4-benzoquinol methylase